MLSRIVGRSKDKEEDTSSQSTRRKDGERKPTRRRSVPKVSSDSRKRGDDRDREPNPTSTSHSSTTRGAVSGTGVGSVTSSYATASSGRKIDEENLPSNLVRNFDQTLDERSERRDRDKDDIRRQKSGRESENDRGWERTQDREPVNKVISREDNRRKERGLSVSDTEPADGTVRAPARPSGSFSEQIGSANFVQFPGQYDSPSGFIGQPTVSTTRISDHVQDQFPGQFPIQSAAPYRPPSGATQGRPGLAADYYGDSGQSVAAQPGVRPHPPSLIVGAQPHLQAASSIVAPPPEPSASGGVGAAASFFTGGFNAEAQGQSNYHQVSAASANVAVYQQAPSKPSPAIQYSSSNRPTSNHSASASALPTLGAAAAGAAAGYLISSQSSHQQRPDHTSSAYGDGQGRVSPAANHRPHSQSQNYDSTTSFVQSTKPSKYSSQSTNVPLYAAGIAGAAHHLNNNSVGNSSGGQQYSSTTLAQRHRHHGPFSKLVDFFKDPDGVAQFEEYTEYIGVCKYCFTPGSSPRDAPRKHHYRRHRSDDRYGGSARVDKDRRYVSSDGETRHRKKKSWVATGIAGYSLAKVAESLFNQGHEQSGRNHTSRGSPSRYTNNHSPDRKSYSSHGITRRSSEVGASRQSDLKNRIEARTTSDDKFYKQYSHGGKLSEPSTTAYDSRRRSKSRSKDRKFGVIGSAIGTAAGSSAVFSNSRRRSLSPKKAFVRSKRRGEEHRHDFSSVLGTSSPENRHGDRRSRYSSPSRMDVSKSSHRKSPERRHKAHKRDKKSKGFFSFSNGSSSSSSNGDLAFGLDSDRRRSGSRSKPRERDHRTADTALMGLGVAATALAINETREKNRSKKVGELVAVKGSKHNHSHSSQRAHQGKKKLSSSHSDEDLWESASDDDEYASADSNLAYGNSSRRASHESISSNASGMSKWGWRWGGKRKEKRVIKPPRSIIDSEVPIQPDASISGKAAGALFGPDVRKHSTGIIKPSNFPLQLVDQVPASDHSGFGAIGRGSTVSSNQPPIILRPEPVPIQHPQPKVSVPPAVYASQPPFSHSYSAPISGLVSGSVFSQDRYQPQPQNYSTGNQSYGADPEDKMPGSFPRGDQTPNAPNLKAKHPEPRRRDTSPSVYVSELASDSIQSRRRNPYQDDVSAVRFDLTEEQDKNNRLKSRRQKEEDEDRRERPRQGKEDEDRRDRLRQAKEDEDHRERRQREQEIENQRERIRQQNEDKERRERLRQQKEDENRRETARQELDGQKHRERSRREREKEDQREKLRQEKEDEDRRERVRQTQDNEVRNEKRRQEREVEAREESRRKEQKRKDQRSIERGRAVSDDRSNKPSSGNSSSNGRFERTREEVRPQIVEIEPRKGNSWAGPVAAGIIGAAIGVAAESETSKPNTQREKSHEQKRREHEYRDTFGEDGKRQVFMEEPLSRFEDVQPNDRPTDEKPMSVWQAAAKVKRSSSHEDYAAYFVPPELLSRSDDQKHATNANADNDVIFSEGPEIITIEPTGFHDSSISPAYSFTPTGDETELHPINLSWVPTLKVIAPTPTPSRAGSINDGMSPLIQPSRGKESAVEEASKSTTDSKVTWGEHETIEYTPITPMDHRDQFIESPSSEHDNEKETWRVSDIEVATNHNQPSPSRGPMQSKDSDFYGDDLEFAAILAAGLEDTGFDPSVVFNDPSFRRRNSPPGSEQAGTYRPPRVGTDKSYSPTRKSVSPPKLELIEGEVPFVHVPGAFDEDEIEGTITAVDKKQGNELAKGQSIDHVLPEEHIDGTIDGTKIISQGPETSTPKHNEFLRNVDSELQGFEQVKANSSPKPDVNTELTGFEQVMTTNQPKVDVDLISKGFEQAKAINSPMMEVASEPKELEQVKSKHLPKTYVDADLREFERRKADNSSKTGVDPDLNRLEQVKAKGTDVDPGEDDLVLLSRNNTPEEEFFDASRSLSKIKDSGASSKEIGHTSADTQLNQGTEDYDGKIQSTISHSLPEKQRRNEGPELDRFSENPDLYEYPSEDALSIAATAPVSNDVDEGRRTRRKSKRRSSDFVDSASSVSSRKYADSTESHSKGRKEKKGLFGFLSRSTENSSESPRNKERPTEPIADAFEESKRDKESKDRRSSRHGSRHGKDISNGKADSPFSPENPEDDYKSRLQQPKGRKDKRRSIGGSTTNDSGRISQDLPAKVYSLATTGRRTLLRQTLTNQKDQEISLGDEARVTETVESLPTNADKENPVEDSQRMSFLGMRQEIPPLPDSPVASNFPKLLEDKSMADVSSSNLQDLALRDNIPPIIGVDDDLSPSSRHPRPTSPSKPENQGHRLPELKGRDENQIYPEAIALPADDDVDVLGLKPERSIEPIDLSSHFHEIHEGKDPEDPSLLVTRSPNEALEPLTIPEAIALPAGDDVDLFEPKPERSIESVDLSSHLHNTLQEADPEEPSLLVTKSPKAALEPLIIPEAIALPAGDDDVDLFEPKPERFIESVDLSSHFHETLEGTDPEEPSLLVTKSPKAALEPLIIPEAIALPAGDDDVDLFEPKPERSIESVDLSSHLHETLEGTDPEEPAALEPLIIPEAIVLPAGDDVDLFEPKPERPIESVDLSSHLHNTLQEAVPEEPSLLVTKSPKAALEPLIIPEAIALPAGDDDVDLFEPKPERSIESVDLSSHLHETLEGTDPEEPSLHVTKSPKVALEPLIIPEAIALPADDDVDLFEVKPKKSLELIDSSSYLDEALEGNHYEVPSLPLDKSPEAALEPCITSKAIASSAYDRDVNLFEGMPQRLFESVDSSSHLQEEHKGRHYEDPNLSISKSPQDPTEPHINPEAIALPVDDDADLFEVQPERSVESSDQCNHPQENLEEKQFEEHSPSISKSLKTVSDPRLTPDTLTLPSDDAQGCFEAQRRSPVPEPKDLSSNQLDSSGDIQHQEPNSSSVLEPEPSDLNSNQLRVSRETQFQEPKSFTTESLAVSEPRITPKASIPAEVELGVPEVFPSLGDENPAETSTQTDGKDGGDSGGILEEAPTQAASTDQGDSGPNQEPELRNFEPKVPEVERSPAETIFKERKQEASLEDIADAEAKPQNMPGHLSEEYFSERSTAVQMSRDQSSPSDKPLLLGLEYTLTKRDGENKGSKKADTKNPSSETDETHGQESVELPIKKDMPLNLNNAQPASFVESDVLDWESTPTKKTKKDKKSKIQEKDNSFQRTEVTPEQRWAAIPTDDTMHLDLDVAQPTPSIETSVPDWEFPSTKKGKKEKKSKKRAVMDSTSLGTEETPEQVSVGLPIDENVPFDLNVTPFTGPSIPEWEPPSPKKGKKDKKSKKQATDSLSLGTGETPEQVSAGLPIDETVPLDLNVAQPTPFNEPSIPEWEPPSTKKGKKDKKSKKQAMDSPSLGTEVPTEQGSAEFSIDETLPCDLNFAQPTPSAEPSVPDWELPSTKGKKDKKSTKRAIDSPPLGAEKTSEQGPSIEETVPFDVNFAQPTLSAEPSVPDWELPSTKGKKDKKSKKRAMDSPLLGAEATSEQGPPIDETVPFDLNDTTQPALSTEASVPDWEPPSKKKGKKDKKSKKRAIDSPPLGAEATSEQGPPIDETVPFDLNDTTQPALSTEASVPDWEPPSKKKGKKDKKSKKRAMDSPPLGAEETSEQGPPIDETVPFDLNDTTQPALSTEASVPDWEPPSKKKGKKDKKSKKRAIDSPPLVAEKTPEQGPSIEETVPFDLNFAQPTLSAEPSVPDWELPSTKGKKDKKSTKRAIDSPPLVAEATSEQAPSIEETVPFDLNFAQPTLSAEPSVPDWELPSTKGKKDKKSKKRAMDSPLLGAEATSEQGPSIDETLPFDLNVTTQPAISTEAGVPDRANPSTKRGKKDKKSKKQAMDSPSLGAEEPPEQASVEFSIDETVPLDVNVNQPTPSAEPSVPDWEVPLTKKTKKSKRSGKRDLEIDVGATALGTEIVPEQSAPPEASVEFNQNELSTSAHPSQRLDVETFHPPAKAVDAETSTKPEPKSVEEPFFATNLDAGVIDTEILQRRPSQKDEERKATRAAKSNEWVEVENEGVSDSINPSQHELSIQERAQPPVPEQAFTDTQQRFQDATSRSPRFPTQQNTVTDDISAHTSPFQWERSITRDSAVHVSDSPIVPESLLFNRAVRDSGYQDIEASPLVQLDALLTAETAEQKNEGATINPSVREIDSDKTIDDQDHQNSHDSENTAENPLNISVEVDPTYDVSISRPNSKRGRSRKTSGATRDHDNPLHSDSNQDIIMDLQTTGFTFDDPREPSPVSSTTKERSSVLFQSSPSTRENFISQPLENGSPVQDAMDVRDSAEQEPRNMPDWAHGLEVSNNEVLVPATERALSPPASIEGPDTDRGSRPSLSGGPLSISDGQRTPSRSPFASENSNRPRLNTISEYSPEESPLHKKNRPISDVGSPERGVKSRRGSATPQRTFQHRIGSPLGAQAGVRNPDFIDELTTRLSWPPVDEDNHIVDLERSRSRNADEHRISRPGTTSAVASGPPKPRDSERRSLSGASVGSVESITAIIRTPDQIRSASGLSPRGSGTPPLRRVDRSVSSDLRLAHKKSEAKNLAKPFEAEPDLPIPSSSTYDPTKDKGKGRVRDMADVYEGWGDVHAAAPLSPTRPPSMRRRQSVQILDLETKLDQLVSENRLLQESKLRAEKTLEVVEQDRGQQHVTFTDAVQTRDLYLRQKDTELNELKRLIEGLQSQVSRLTEINEDLTGTRGGLELEYQQRYSQLEADHTRTHQQWQQSTLELNELKHQHAQVSTGMEEIVRHEISVAVEEKNLELQKLRDELEDAKEQVRALQQQILASRSSENFIIERDEDYFDSQCQELCGHVQQWVLRFSKFSDSRACYLANEIEDEKVTDRFENAVLDGSDVDDYLRDRVKRRDVFMSVVMSLVWEYIFTRYLFGMDREQRQKLKALEKTLAEVGPATAVNKWRATTLTLLSQRESFRTQRTEDTEAVVQEIYNTLATFLPPPPHLVNQILDSLRKVMGAAVDLSIEMRTQRAEYMMLPPLQPVYDTRGDLVRKVYFNASVMNERSGTASSNEAVEAQQAVVRMVLFPLVVKRGGDAGGGEEQIVVCPAQVLTAKPAKDKKVVRVMSAEGGRSAVSFGPSDVDMGNMI